VRIRKLVLGIVLACSCVVDAKPISKKRRSRRIKNSKLKIQQKWIRTISDFLADDKKAGNVLKKLLINNSQIKGLDHNLFKQLNAQYLSSERNEVLKEILKNLPADFSFKTLFNQLQAYKAQKKPVKADKEKSWDSPTSSARSLKDSSSDWDLFVANVYQPGPYVNAVNPRILAGRAYHFENYRPRAGEQMGQYVGSGSPNWPASMIKTVNPYEERAQTVERKRYLRFYP
jgi:hypothetical protein